ncbi:hypothetical protein ACYOEI_00435 [Singulisphaera rosea]
MFGMKIRTALILSGALFAFSFIPSTAFSQTTFTTTITSPSTTYTQTHATMTINVMGNSVRNSGTKLFSYVNVKISDGVSSWYGTAGGTPDPTDPTKWTWTCAVNVTGALDAKKAFIYVDTYDHLDLPIAPQATSSYNINY